MKKSILLFVVFMLICVNSFAQRQTPEVRALQGTWTLIAIMNAEESYNEQAINNENLIVTYIFSGNSVTINNSGTIIGPVNFTSEGAYLVLTGANTVNMPYFLHENILVLHEGGYTFIYQRK